MAQRTPTRGTIEEEIEETQRQIRRSAQLIQSAFEGLSTLHGRVTEAAALRTQARTASGPSRNQAAATDASGSRSVQSPGRSAMDPGHNAILLSTVLQLPAATDTAAPAATAPAPSVGPSAASISTLSNLGSDLMTSSESVRSRAGELDELRRAIAMHSLDLRAHAFRELERDRTPRNAPLADTSATAASGEVREASENLPPQVVRSRTLAGDSAFQRRFADDPSTSLGVMVTARASLAAARRNAATPTNADEHREAGRASVSSASSSSSHRPSPPPSRPSQSASSSSSSPPPADANAPIPDGIATRFSRLAQEIQQDISRISQQSESLMSWINDNRARIDAGLAAIRPPLSLTLAIPTPPRERTADRSPSPSANRTPRPAHANIAAATAAASVLGLATHVPVTTANAFSGATSGAGSDAANLTPRERYVLQLLEAANGGHRRWDAPSSLPAPDANGTSNGPSPSTSRDVLATSTSTPLSPPPPAAPGAEVSTTYLETDYVAALARVRALTRRGPTLNDADESSSEEEPPVRRGHRVRRRLNADGDIVERSVPVRVSRSSFSSWSRTQTPGQQRERSDADEERDPFAQTDNGFISAYERALRAERARNGEAYNPAPGSRAVGGTRNRWDGGTPNSRAGMDADGNPLPNTANTDWMNRECPRCPCVCCAQADHPSVRSRAQGTAEG
ncbi:hypothetical protein C2E23DRAFT_851952 [Lenzites betulinus]|nr:hypothetical protein C2E23DRAFT_851952 [Lenzites betulinus]